MATASLPRFGGRSQLAHHQKRIIKQRTTTPKNKTKKPQLSVFRLQFVLGYNWARRAPSLDYRLTTKWGDGPRIRRKERVREGCVVLSCVRGG